MEITYHLKTTYIDSGSPEVSPPFLRFIPVHESEYGSYPEHISLSELWWYSNEKHNESHIASLAELKRATAFSPVKGEPGWGLSKETIIKREKTWQLDPFCECVTESEASLDEVEQLIRRTPQWSRTGWAWEQFWHPNPCRYREPEGYVWNAAGSPNPYRLSQADRSTKLLRCVGWVIELPNLLLRHVGYGIHFAAYWSEPSAGIMRGDGSGAVDWSRVAHFWRVGFYKITKRAE